MKQKNEAYRNVQCVVGNKALHSPSSGSTDWWRHYAISRKVAVSIPDEVTEFLNVLNPSSCIMVLGSPQPPTEIITRNVLGGKGRPERKADNPIAIYEATVYKISESRHQPYGPPRPVIRTVLHSATSGFQALCTAAERS
jgi:hypothetical protein